MNGAAITVSPMPATTMRPVGPIKRTISRDSGIDAGWDNDDVAVQKDAPHQIGEISLLTKPSAPPTALAVGKARACAAQLALIEACATFSQAQNSAVQALTTVLPHQEIQRYETPVVCEEAEEAALQPLVETVAFDEANTVDVDPAVALEQMLGYLNTCQYKKLPAFEAHCNTQNTLEANLGALEEGLRDTQGAFSARAFLEKAPEEVSQKALQDLDCEISAKIQANLQSLTTTLKNVENVIQAYENKLPSKKHEYIIRGIGVFLTSIVSVALAAIFAISVWWLSPTVLLASYGVDTWKRIIDQKLTEWKAFKSSLENLNEQLKRKKDTMDSTVVRNLADSYAVVKQQVEELIAAKAEDQRQIQELKDLVKQQAEEAKASEKRILAALGSLKDPNAVA